MAEVHTNEVHIDENNYQELAGDVMEGQVEQLVMEEQAGDIEHGGNIGGVQHAGDAWEQDRQESFRITPSAIALWNYAQEIVQDDMEHGQTHPHASRPAHPPIQISRRDKCLLALMVEDRREAVFRLWQELNEMEQLLGLEHI